LDGLAVAFISREHLIRNKKAAGRPKIFSRSACWRRPAGSQRRRLPSASAREVQLWGRGGCKSGLANSMYRKRSSYS
jgi:hypothetical protein